MKFSMTGQKKGNFLVQVTPWAGSTVYCLVLLLQRMFLDRCLSFFCWPLYCRLTASDCPFGIFKLFLNSMAFQSFDIERS
jgi:hypothetical protein